MFLFSLYLVLMEASFAICYLKPKYGRASLFKPLSTYGSILLKLLQMLIKLSPVNATLSNYHPNLLRIIWKH